MTREERKSELRIIISRMESVMNVLSTMTSEFEELGCVDVALKVDAVCERLQDAMWAASGKEASL